MATRVADEERIFRVNVAIDQGLAQSYGINGTPTLIMFRNGREVRRIDGPRPTMESVLAAVSQPFDS